MGNKVYIDPFVAYRIGRANSGVVCYGCRKTKALLFSTCTCAEQKCFSDEDTNNTFYASRTCLECLKRDRPNWEIIVAEFREELDKFNPIELLGDE